MNSTRERLLASSMLGGAILMALASTGAAQAQTAAAKPATAAAATEVEEIVVTGSLFRRTDTETPSPVTVMTSETLQAAGITTVSDAIRSVSADGAGSIGTGFQSGFSGGGAAVSLRGLGVSSTLVLQDGLRSTNFPINDDGHNAYVDLNSIAFSMLSSVEVLKDGASSIYGADAIGGVVNLKMRKTFNGLKGSLEGGQASRGDADHSRAELAVGFGNYDEQGFNFYVGAEYQKDGRVRLHDRGFPFNTLDLSSIGGLDNNPADSSLTTGTPTAVVVRVAQTDLNNPLAGGTTILSNQAVALGGTANCANGTFTVTTGAVQGTSCKYDLQDQFLEAQPEQERYAYTAKLSFKINDNIEGYATGTYSSSSVSIRSAIPRSIRETAIYGGNPAISASVPGIVLPVYVCATGLNCATAPDRRLNPNNPFAAAFATDPSNGAARIYFRSATNGYGSDRVNEVIRGAAGLTGSFDKWNWKVDAVAARDNLQLTDHGFFNVAGLLNAINTGSYNFVNPSLNTAAVRNAVTPDVVTPSRSEMLSLDASVTRELWELPGGPMQLALGAQVRREELVNNTRVPRLDVFGLSVAAAYGQHTVKAAFFEVEAPVIKELVLGVSGRYDSYSEGFSHFSPKLTAKWTPLKELAFRGTYSQGFRAPTFAESGARSAFPGFSTFVPPAAFQLQHGGLTAAPTSNTNPYAQSYSLGSGVAGNPALNPETSTSYTLGVIAQPFRWLSATLDYYKVKKDGLIVTGPLGGQARNAYYSQSTSAAGCAAVAAVGTGYSCNLLDAPDPLFPNAMPRILIINVPFVNANALEDQGLDFSATATIDLPYEIRWTSKVETTYTLQHDLITPAGVQKYAGTLGPYELSSGNGTPKIRGNWQNTLNMGRYQLSATAYYVGKIKAVATDEGNLSTDCSAALYVGKSGDVNQFCYVKSFLDVDLNGSVEVREGLRIYANVGNLFDARAPIDPAGYTSSPNYMTTWHAAGVLGRTYKLGVKFEF